MNGDMDGFMEGMPQTKGFDPKELFQALQTFGVKNEEFTNEELRDFYTEGRLYQVGDIVESLSNGMVGEIHRCGTNHLIVVTDDGIMFKSFIQDVQAV